MDDPSTSPALPLPDAAPDSEPLPDPLPDPDGQLVPPEPDPAEPDVVVRSLADAAPEAFAEAVADAAPEASAEAVADADPEALPEPPQSPKLRTSAPSSSPHAAPMVASASDSAVAVVMR
ncbi:MAG: hypothetical protein ACRD0V_03645 [Acidimicrobiales bacterium]